MMPVLENVVCTVCGAYNKLCNPRSMSVVCRSCRSLIDLKGDACQIIGRFPGHFHKLPLHTGWEGVYAGESVKVAGRLRYVLGLKKRDDYYILSEGGRNLLLMACDGKPAFYELIMPIEAIDPYDIKKSLVIDNKEQAIISSGMGRIVQADGEVIWKISRNDYLGWVETADYAIRFSRYNVRYYRCLGRSWIGIRDIFGSLDRTPYTEVFLKSGL